MANALVITRGEDRTFSVPVLDALLQPADLTDAYLWFTAKSSVEMTDADAEIRKDSDNGVTVVGDPVDGIAAVTLDAADTADLDNQGGRRGLMFYWDIKVKDSEDKITALAKGVLVVEADVTRASVP